MKIQNKQEKRIKTNISKYKISGLLLILLLSIMAIPTVIAHCPLCTGATIVGIGVTRSLGLDDSIVGVFVGAMIVSSGLWINNILKRKNMNKGRPLLRISGLILLTLVLTYISFYLAGIFGLGNPYRIFGIEKITFGTISGGIVSLAAFFISNEIKRKNNGSVLFNYQTMTLTFIALILNVLAFWLIF